MSAPENHGEGAGANQILGIVLVVADDLHLLRSLPTCWGRRFINNAGMHRPRSEIDTQRCLPRRPGAKRLDVVGIRSTHSLGIYVSSMSSSTSSIVASNRSLLIPGAELLATAKAGRRRSKFDGEERGGGGGARHDTSEKTQNTTEKTHYAPPPPVTRSSAST